MRSIIFFILLNSILLYAQNSDIALILKSSSTDSVKVNRLNEFARKGSNQFEARKEALDSAFGLAHRNIYHYGKAVSYLSFAYLYLDADSVSKAIDYFRLAIIGFQDLNLPKETAEAQYKLARTYQAIGLLDRANEIYHSLLKTYEKVGTRVGHVYLQLANNYIDLGKEDSAVVYSSRLQDSEVRRIPFSYTFTNIQKNKFQNRLEVKDLKNELEKAKFRTDVIAFLLGILLAISILIIIYLVFKVRKFSKS